MHKRGKMKRTKRFLLVVIALTVFVRSNSNASDELAKTLISSEEKAGGEAAAQSQDADLKDQVAELKRLVQSQQGRIEKLESELKSAHENTGLGQVGTEFTAKPKVEQAQGHPRRPKKLSAKRAMDQRPKSMELGH
jgi:hypothetical protein